MARLFGGGRSLVRTRLLFSRKFNVFLLVFRCVSVESELEIQYEHSNSMGY